ncbi:MAG TPA: hypothetical protein VEQ67_12230, partial [Mycobacterium sp.]|nr:hypothetical protein [Mycobacterium sp.]
HAPGACQYCDMYPTWQQLRELWRLNFTGENDPDKAPCPSTHTRPAEVRDRWYGNRPYPPGTQPPSMFEWTVPGAPPTTSWVGRTAERIHRLLWDEP